VFGLLENLNPLPNNKIYVQRTVDQQHMYQLPEWTDQAQPPISSTALFKALETLVESGQRRLTAEFDHRHIMLQLDADDHRLISAVYVLNPTGEQVR
jgi:hypothetical protein